MPTLILALTIGTLATARAVRLITHDDWPPTRLLREWWVLWQENRDLDHGHGVFSPLTTTKHGISHGWAALLDCPFCFAPYAALVNLSWAVWSGAPWRPVTEPLGWSWAGVWWLVNFWAAVAYIAAMVVARDEPPEE